jgi:hypothetical protein
MSLADELQKLEQLKSSGALSAEEFQQAKTKLLSSPSEPVSPPSEPEYLSSEQSAETLGRAANRYVSFRIVMAVIGLIIFLIVFFTVILPHLVSGPSFQGPHFP